MSRNNNLTTIRDNKIRERYTVLSEKKIGDKHLYRREAVLEMLSMEFYLTPDWIGRIVMNVKVTDDTDPDQIKLFE